LSRKLEKLWSAKKLRRPGIHPCSNVTQPHRILLILDERSRLRTGRPLSWEGKLVTSIRAHLIRASFAQGDNFKSGKEQTDGNQESQEGQEE